MPKNKDKGKSKQAQRAEQWAKGRKRVNWDVVWKVLASVFSFAGSMVAAYELVNYFRSDTKTFYSIIFPGLVIIVWAIILIQLVRKNNPYAILLLAFTVLGGVAGGIGWRSYNQAQEDKFIALVASFDGPEETYGLRRQMMEDLRAATQNYRDIAIIESDSLVTSSEHAREVGQQESADLVIWAWYRPTENPNITIHFENLSTAQIESLEESETYQPQASLDDLESFSIQKQIGSETANLISFLTGYLRYKLGDFSTALRLFENVSQSGQDIPIINQAYNFLFSGDCYYQLGHYDSAIKKYDYAIELEPDFAVAYNNRGMANLDSEQFTEALADFNRVLEINPDSGITYSNLGTAYLRLSKYDESLESYTRAIKLLTSDDSSKPYNGRGMVYLHLGEVQSAISDFSIAIQLNPDYSSAYYNRGLAYQSLGNVADAEADFKKYEELTGQQP